MARYARDLLRRARLHLAIFGGVAILACALFALSVGGWYAREPLRDPEYGINFSCKRAQYFGQDCAEVFRRALDDFAVKAVRISAYWSDVENEPGVYDFGAVDQLLDIAQSRGVRVTVSIGMKAQRYPEYWFPTWLRLAANMQPQGYPEDSPLVQQYLTPYLQAAAAHIGAHPAVEAIQVENEPFVHFRSTANGWRIRKPFLAEEIATVRAADPGRHPIVVSHASWLRRDHTWEWILENADVLAQSVYTKRQRGPWPWLYIFPYRIGSLTPDLPAQGRAAERQGKQLWILELQAEPFEQPTTDVRRIPTEDAASFSRRWLDDNVRLARRSGATRVYLWGVEWWSYLKDERGDPELWNAARELLRPTPPPMPARSR